MKYWKFRSIQCQTSVVCVWGWKMFLLQFERWTWSKLEFHGTLELKDNLWNRERFVSSRGHLCRRLRGDVANSAIMLWLKELCLKSQCQRDNIFSINQWNISIFSFPNKGNHKHDFPLIKPSQVSILRKDFLGNSKEKSFRFMLECRTLTWIVKI